jgi:hypothetical protein
LSTGGALLTVDAVLTGRTLRAGRALLTVLAILAVRAICAIRARWALRTLSTGRASRACRALPNGRWMQLRFQQRLDLRPQSSDLSTVVLVGAV